MILALCSACGSTSKGNDCDKTNYGYVTRALTENDLANATYRIHELGTFQLVNGEFEHRYGEEGMTQLHKVTLEKIAFGDLDHDGTSDAAVVLAWQSGGSGTFKYLFAMRNTRTAPRQQDHVLLGDRIQISALSIAAGQVNIDMFTTGPDEPVCCPTQRVKLAYILSGDKWVQNIDKVIQPDASIDPEVNITEIVWKWKRFDNLYNSYNFVIDEPNKYTLILFPDGSYQVTADCNRMQGQYTIQDNGIKIAPGAATLAECTPESRYAEYLRYLTEGVSFVLHENKLVLNLMVGRGQLVFENGGVVSDYIPTPER